MITINGNCSVISSEESIRMNRFFSTFKDDVEIKNFIIDSRIPDIDIDDLTSKNIVDKSVKFREKLRKQKFWDLADKIRDQLADVGIKLIDSKKGTIVQRIE